MSRRHRRRRLGRSRARRGRRHLDALRVRRLRGDAAHILAPHHADVPLLAPRAAPRVLDLPEVEAGVGIRAVAHDEHAVVELLAAHVGVQHPGLVQLEGRLVRLDGNRDGILSDRSHERVLVVDWHVLVSGQHHGPGAHVLLAHAGNARARSVRVLVLRAQRIALCDPFEGVVHETARAAVVAVCVALHQLLLGERDQLASGDGEAALDRPDGRESPARAAPRLVLDLGDRPLRDPVHLARNRQSVLGVLEVNAPRVLRIAVEEQLGHDGGGEFGPGHVGPLVVTQSV
mmetsp:Transcript_5108/g.16878  ORF Transcript_5108/g.16878 Transcript_5108/m.16878 type:complete len:288 (+) Transcript_5108:792-1655(+)|eukprot:scaffold29538_cov120-Isochrysis_galbana.AAC.9